MEWFAFSSKFYLDLDDQGVSEKAQMLLMRICAYVADNETSGIISDAAIRKLGIRQVSTRLEELLEHKLIVRVSVNSRSTRDQLANNSHTNSRTTRDQLVNNSTYEIPAWFKWNEALERLVKKRKADRERIAEKRRNPSNVARQSREKNAMSHDYIDSNNKENSKEFSSSSLVSNGREEQPRGPAVPVDAWKLIRAVIPNEHPQAVKTDLALRAGALIKSGTPEPTVRAALELWLTKPNVGPGILPSLVSEVIRSASPLHAVPDTGQPQLGPASQKAAGWLAVGQNLTNPHRSRELE